MSARQEIIRTSSVVSEPVPPSAAGAQGAQGLVRTPGVVSEPVPPLTVAIPREGERFTDEELGARFGVPLRGGIRVSRANKCMVLVHLVGISSGYTNTDYGTAVSYMGQNADPDGIQNQQMSGNNLALSRSTDDGYTVLYFIKEGTDLVFNSRVVYVSHGFEVETNRIGQPRVVIKFKLKAVDGTHSMESSKTESSKTESSKTESSKTESLGCPLLAELEEDKLPTETIGEYVARMANNMEPGLCTQADAEEMDEDFRRLARGEYDTLDSLRAEFDSKCT